MDICLVGGFGLGLAVVQGILRAHQGGSIVDGTVGLGTKFYVYLPLCEVAAAEKSAPVPVAQGRGERVLFVDDEALVGHFARMRLEQMHYAVSVFEDPLIALAAMRANPNDYDVIVSDFAMPGFNGLDLVRQVREIRRNFPAIIVTGNSSALLPSQLATLANVAVVEKPFTGDDIARALQRVLPS